MPMYQVLWRVVLGASHVPTGRTRHYVGGALMPTRTELQIVAIPGAQGVYLLYIDREGNELTDTYHETVEDAMGQAEFEFQVAADDWTLTSDNERG